MKFTISSVFANTLTRTIKVVKTLNRRQATPYYMPASEEEQIYQQISGQDVPSISAEHVQ